VRLIAPALLPVFRSRLQGELLALLHADASAEWTVHDLAERTGQPYQTVGSEVRRLETADLVTTRSVGRSKLLRANADSPYSEPLAQLALLTFGPPLVLEEEFGHLAGVERIFIFGSWAARYAGETGPAPRDIDVLLVGDPDRDAAYEATRRAEHRLGREISLVIRDPETWASADDGFTRQLRASALLEIDRPSQPGKSSADGGLGE
jgi:predicted nucleotidyltransferase